MHYLINILLKCGIVVNILLGINLFSVCVLFFCFRLDSVVWVVNKLLGSGVFSLCINITLHFSCAYNLLKIKIIMVIINISLIINDFTNLFFRFALGWSIMEVHLTITLRNLSCSLFISFGLFLATRGLTLYEIICLGLSVPRWHLRALNNYLLLLRICN